MPHLDASSYRCPWPLKGPHLATIVPNVSRRRIRIAYRRERLELSDGDFVDLDTCSGRDGSAESCLLMLHGLEGSSTAPYVKSMAQSAVRRLPSLDAVAMNMRGCSGELNRKARFYHSGESGDLAEVVLYLENRYETIYLLGFSLGGNVVLKYVGEFPDGVSRKVRAAAAVSAPVDLQGSAKRIGERSNGFYMKRFIRLLSEKIEAKAELYPDVIDAEGCRQMASFVEFDGTYTAPLCGFASAEDYWRKCSALNWLADIRVPALLLNALDDPFLSEGCFPEETASRSSFLHACFPRQGGHLGFPGRRVRGEAWHERVALDFLLGKPSA
ncbi:alpha/beta fold hydrolase [Pelagicoccus sp. SDUM812003]|uniref:YheT family hydrolase n=1 Tax=Pelagicoccus sp. SDUM812003 TaxID=3041267 RepID=UPI00280D3559|nr:alpha/beta fold hydrolase [Pelagicoccus sp. SDUM812003]MDQ8201680.1 alpha/beta fold hydrolase [Pelagicoccus sp. SDUM812003]